MFTRLKLLLNVLADLKKRKLLKYPNLGGVCVKRKEEQHVIYTCWHSKEWSLFDIGLNIFLVL